MAPRYTVNVWEPNQPKRGPVFAVGTEEVEATVAYAARRFPECRISVFDNYGGTTEIHRDYHSDTEAEVSAAFVVWADFGGSEAEFAVTGQSGAWLVHVPIGGGFNTFAASAVGQNGFQFKEVDNG